MSWVFRCSCFLLSPLAIIWLAFLVQRRQWKAARNMHVLKSDQRLNTSTYITQSVSLKKLLCVAGFVKLMLCNFNNLVSCRIEDEWSTLAVNCLEQFSRSAEVLNVVPSCSSNRLSSKDNMHTFQHLVDCCSELTSSHGPVWPEHYSALLVELYRLLVTKNSEALLYAMQLSVILLPRNSSTHLRHLLLFMQCAADSTQVKLSSKASNQSLLGREMGERWMAF